MTPTFRLLFAVFVMANILGPPRLASAQGYQVDANTMDIVKHFNILTIHSLAVGETGLVSLYALAPCVDSGEMKVPGDAKLDTNPSKYSYSYAVTRHPNNVLTIVLSEKGKAPNEDAVSTALLSLTSAEDCEYLTQLGIPLFTVKSFLGSARISELLANPVLPPQQPTSSNATGKVLLGELGVGIDHNWIENTGTSPIDDSPTITLSRIADNIRATLVLRCRENKTEAMILSDRILGDPSKTVTLRYDKMKAANQTFSLSTDNKALFFSRPIPSIKDMLKHSQMTVRYADYRGSTTTVTFKLNGLSKAIDPLREACHW